MNGTLNKSGLDDPKFYTYIFFTIFRLLFNKKQLREAKLQRSKKETLL